MEKIMENPISASPQGPETQRRQASLDAMSFKNPPASLHAVRLRTPRPGARDFPRFPPLNTSLSTENVLLGVGARAGDRQTEGVRS